MTDNSANSQRTLLYGLLGDLPPRDGKIGATTLGTTQRDGYQLETLLLELNGIEPVSAYFVRPLAPGRYPCIVYNHAHGGNYEIGKEELLSGRGMLQSPPYARALTENGYAALCIDHWCFGERRGRTESATFKQMLWEGRVLWGMMIYDSLRAVDYLNTRGDVNADRLATLGASFGSTMAWWLAALDPRIKVCIDICCLSDYQALIDQRTLDGHSVYYFVPSLLKHFTAGQINALIAPRPHLGLAGIYDPLTPVAGLDRIDAELKRVYAETGNPAGWLLRRYATGHIETAHMRVTILEWLRQWL
ncbi:MAG: acetylxylan esterase [Anaerolineae bacterium]|nr:acetylxylan esterase [Anaerolineae bacterium]